MKSNRHRCRLALAFLASVSWLAAQVEVTSTGVGIGTTTPAKPLEVVGPALSSPLWQSEVLRVTASGNSAGLGIDAGSSNWGVSLFQGGNKVFTVDSNAGALIGGSYVHLNAPANGLAVEGYVGLGTTNPDGRLHITGAPNNWTSNGWRKGIRLDNVNALEFGGGDTIKYGIGASDNALWFFDTTAEDGSAPANYRMILRNGMWAIGTYWPTHPLTVNGTVRATAFVADVNTYADFVLKPDYRLASLTEVEAHIAEKGHLPGIPSEAEAREKGIDVVEMQVRLLQKIEEITLHQIAQQKELAALKAENAELREALLAR